MGNFVFRHGEHFYNFGGLRRYKAKFDPVWEPRYLVAPGGVALPRILIDVSVLIAGRNERAVRALACAVRLDGELAALQRLTTPARAGLPPPRQPLAAPGPWSQPSK